MGVVGKTKSMCPKCMKFLTADLIDKDGDLFISRNCEEHGMFETLHCYDKTENYIFMRELFLCRRSMRPVSILVDVTHRCNMNCEFCFDKTPIASEEEEPTLGEIKSQLKDFSGTFVHICGGEPTLRKDLPEIIKMITEMGYRVILMTNGSKLDEGYAKILKEHGLHRVNLQFDYLDATKRKIVGILDKYGIAVSMFTRIMVGKNEDEIRKLVKFATENNIVKSIYLIPTWRAGRYSTTEQIRRSSVISIMGEFGISYKEICDSNKFVFYSIEIFKDLFGVENAGINLCKSLCPVFVEDGRLIPISRLFDVEIFNDQLKKIHEILGEKGLSRYVKAAFKFPFSHFIIKSLTDIRFLRFLRSIVVESINSRREDLFITNRGFEITNIIIGVFADKYNMDTEILGSCNFYQKDPNGVLIPLCLRKVLY
jgi:uncharacterized radical SAM superfamily Fe-S cluster-containing enzyme